MATRILHIALLFCVLLSSTGFVLGKHHCKRMEELKDSNLEMVSCSDMGGCKKGCCSKEATYFHLDQDQQLPQLDVDLPKCQITVQIKSAWAFKALMGCHYRFPLSQSPPPISQRDKLVLFQTFLC